MLVHIASQKRCLSFESTQNISFASTQNKQQFDTDIILTVVRESFGV